MQRRNEAPPGAALRIAQEATQFAKRELLGDEPIAGVIEVAIAVFLIFVAIVTILSVAAHMGVPHG